MDERRPFRRMSTQRGLLLMRARLARRRGKNRAIFGGGGQHRLGEGEGTALILNARQIGGERRHCLTSGAGARAHDIGKLCSRETSPQAPGDAGRSMD